MKPPSSPGQFDSSEPVLPPDCAASRASLQNRLDGDNRPESAAAREHRSLCTECKALESASQILLSALPALRKVECPPGFADRVLAQMVAESERSWLKRRWTRVAGFALAASMLIAVAAVITERRTTNGTRGVVVVVAPPVQVESTAIEIVREKPALLRESFQEAGSAVAALTRKVTADSFGLKLPQWPLGNAKVDPLPNMDAGAVMLQEVRHNAMLSIAPITDSAKRALDVFWRELGPEMETKPTNN